MFRWGTIKTVGTARNIVLMTRWTSTGQRIKFGQSRLFAFFKGVLPRGDRWSVAFRHLISAMIGFSDLCMDGVALGIASQDSIEFISTRFLLKFWKCSCSSNIAGIRFSRISSWDSILFLSNGWSSFLMLLFLNPTKIACKKRSCTRASLYPQLSYLDMNNIFCRSDMSLTVNSCADSDGNYLLLLSSVNKYVALGSLKWYLSILLNVSKFQLSFPSKYVRSAKSGAILLMTGSQISCSLYPFFNPLLIWKLRLGKVSLSFCPGVPILLFILYSLNLIKLCNFSFISWSWWGFSFLLKMFKAIFKTIFIQIHLLIKCITKLVIFWYIVMSFDQTFYFFWKFLSPLIPPS